MKFERILSMEFRKPNYFPQHITDIREFLINELKTEKEELSRAEKEQEN